MRGGGKFGRMSPRFYGLAPRSREAACAGWARRRPPHVNRLWVRLAKVVRDGRPFFDACTVKHSRYAGGEWQVV